MRENRTSGICGGALETGPVEMGTDLSTGRKTASGYARSSFLGWLPRQRTTRQKGSRLLKKPSVSM